MPPLLPDSLLGPNISGSQPSRFKVTRRHQSRHHLIRHVPFPAGSSLQPSLYLRLCLRYMHPNVIWITILVIKGSRDVIGT